MYDTSFEIGIVFIPLKIAWTCEQLFEFGIEIAKLQYYKFDFSVDYANR